MRFHKRVAPTKTASTKERDARRFLEQRQRSWILVLCQSICKRLQIPVKKREMFFDSVLKPAVDEVMQDAAAKQFKDFRGWKGYVTDRFNHRCRGIVNPYIDPSLVPVSRSKPKPGVSRPIGVDLNQLGQDIARDAQRYGIIGATVAMS